MIMDSKLSSSLVSLLIRFFGIGPTNWIQVGFWTGLVSFTIANMLKIQHSSDTNTNLIPPTVLQFLTYGRLKFNGTTENKFLAMLKVPKKWFFHFYLFGICFQSIVIATVLYSYLLDEPSSNSNSLLPNLWLVHTIEFFGGNKRAQSVDATTTVLATILFLFHLLRRFYETLFVSIFSGNKMSPMIYLGSFEYYFLAIISLIAHSPKFCCTPSQQHQAITWSWLSMYNCFGIAIVLYGFVQQYNALLILGNLRRDNDGNKDIREFKHEIPYGGLFNLVSSPHYTMEIVIYIGFSVLFGLKNPTWNAVTAFVISSQIFVGITSHQWNLEHFHNYPERRKAIIPYFL